MQLPAWIPATLLSALFASLVPIFGKLGVQHVDSTLASTIRAAIMFGTLLLVSVASGRFTNLHQLTQGKTLLFIVLSAVAGALSWIAYFWALRIGPASKIGPIEKVSLVLTVVLAAALLGESVSAKVWIGTALMTIGAIFVALG